MTRESADFVLERQEIAEKRTVRTSSSRRCLSDIGTSNPFFRKAAKYDLAFIPCGIILGGS
jgi:hypothetical protein